MTAALEGVSGQQHALAALYPRERLGTLCTGGWVGTRAGLEVCQFYGIFIYKGRVRLWKLLVTRRSLYM